MGDLLRRDNPFAPPIREETGPAPRATIRDDLFSPRAILFISAFFSFVAGGILVAVNQARLGHPERKIPIIATTLVVFLGFAFVVYVLPDDHASLRLLKWMNTTIAIGLWLSQRPAYRKHVAAGGSTASPWPAAGISLVGMVLVVGALLIWVERDMAALDARIEQADALIEEERYDEARVVYEQIVADDPEYGDGHYNLSYLYLELDRRDDAIRHALIYQRLAPADAEETELLDVLGLR
jgi:tetratricopeptide (TPR) repeat protein